MLLVFVAITIPAGIYAKVHYGEELANVDWLHGSAEVFLTLSNIFGSFRFSPGNHRSQKARSKAGLEGVVAVKAVAIAL